MTIYISFVTALYLLFTKKDYLKYKNQDIAQLLSDFLTFWRVFDNGDFIDWNGKKELEIETEVDYLI